MKIFNFFLLQWFNYDLNFNYCFNQIEKFHTDKSLRIVILQTEEYKLEINDFIENLIGFLYSNQFITTILIEKKFLWSEETSNLNVIDNQLVVGYNEEMYFSFLEMNPRILIPFARNSYKFIFVKKFKRIEELVTRLWDFGVLKVCFCDFHQRFVYSPFSRNLQTWSFGSDFNSFINFLNFQQFPLKISMFDRNPTSLKTIPKLLKFNPIYSHCEFVGIDGSVLTNLAGYLNFSINLVDGFRKEHFGWVLPNGSITGSLGLVAAGKAHISLNGRFLMNYGTQAVEFTVPYSSDEICAFVPKAKRIPQWLSVSNSFEPITWFAIYSSFLICVFLWFFIRDRKEILVVFWEMFSIFHGIPIKLILRFNQIFFLFWCLMANVILLNLVQGSFFKSFTTPSFYKDINTLEDLDKSNFPIATNFYFFGSEGSELMSRLKKKRILSFPNLFDSIAFNRNVAKLERKRDLKAFIKTHYLDDDGLPLLHIVDECFTTYFMSYIVPKGSAFLEIFNQVLIRFVEAGLTLKWYQDVEDSVMLEILTKLNKNKKLWEPFQVYDLQAAFFVWFVGILVATLVGFLEIISKFYKKQ